MLLRTTTALLLLSLLLSACTVRLVQPVAGPPTTPTLVAAQAELEADLRAVIAAEVQARQAGDANALAALLDPAADPSWVERQRERMQWPITGVEVQRLFGSGDLAVAGVIETQAQTDGTPLAYYDTRVLRHTPEGWKLTAPTPEAWGDPMTMTVGTLTLTYRAFDAPDVQAMAPRLERALSQMVADFGLANAAPEAWVVTVKPFFAGDAPPRFDDPAALAVPSPFTSVFPTGQAASPAEFLLGSTVDTLGHALLGHAFAASASEEGRFALGHTAVQWEVEQATGTDFTSRLRTAAEPAAPGEGPTRLSTLLDPTQFSAEGRTPADRELFVRFLVERYGRSVLGPYLKAVFTADSAEDVVPATTGEDLATVERAWLEWLAQ